jgi:PAB-dependent poly(A)-specific ribonuclease subunit 3
MINDMGQGAFNGDGHNSSSRPYSQQKNNMLRQQAVMSSGLLPEAIIWNYIIQLTSALRCIHGAGLACRTLDPTKILVINKTRVLLNCVGIFDVLTFDPNSSNPVTAMAVYQQEDLVSLGRIALALACNSFMAIQRENLQASMEVVTSTYSSDLRNLIMYLLTNPQRVKTVNDLMPMIGARFYTALDSAQQRNDALEVELAKDIESARLFKLLAKLSTVVDRAEFHMDTSWAETGDRYMLKLFRDYVFHQVMEDGRPFLDMSHVIANLNKLDTGVPDQICLMSRDEQNVLVVSYAELKNCLEQSYGDILASATAKPKLQ